jgi:hypothetical protein
MPCDVYLGDMLFRITFASFGAFVLTCDSLLPCGGSDNFYIRIRELDLPPWKVLVSIDADAFGESMQERTDIRANVQQTNDSLNLSSLDTIKDIEGALQKIISIPNYRQGCL